MPVLITGAESVLGRATARAMLRSGGEVRVYLDAELVGDDTAEDYRRLGCKVALGTRDDEGHLESALTRVHTLVHLDAGPLATPETLVDELATAVSAALGAGCRRVVWTSAVGAEAADGNAYLQACADGEELLADTPVETVVVRPSLTYGRGDALTNALARGGLQGADGDARHAPLYLEDLAAALAEADRQRQPRSDLHVVVALAGPDVVSLVEFLNLLQAALAPPTTGAAALPAAARAWLSRGAVPGPDALGRHGTPLRAGLERLRLAT